MTLICAGVAHQLSSSAWSKVLIEIHVCEHDLRELKYLHADIKLKKSLGYKVQSYQPFSNFDNQSAYAGFYPSWLVFKS